MLLQLYCLPRQHFISEIKRCTRLLILLSLCTTLKRMWNEWTKPFIFPKSKPILDGGDEMVKNKDKLARNSEWLPQPIDNRLKLAQELEMFTNIHKNRTRDY